MYSIDTIKILSLRIFIIAIWINYIDQWQFTFHIRWYSIFFPFRHEKLVSVYSKVIFIILWNNSFHFFFSRFHMKSLICYKFADGENFYALQIEIYYGSPSRSCFVLIFFFLLLFDDERCSSHFLLILFFIIYFLRLIHIGF